RESGTSVEARAVISATAARALQSIDPRAGPIDLAHFDASLPRTPPEVTLQGAASPPDALRGPPSVRNPAPGPLDTGLLPVRPAAGFAALDFPALRLETLRIALAGNGRLEGEAHANAERVNALLQASAINLRALRSDLRRSALRGPLEISLRRDVQLVDGSL